MTTFLIQVSGDISNHDETKAHYWWEEPIKENVYINYHWKKEKERKEAWMKAKENGNHRLLIYCTGTVNPCPYQIRYVAQVTSVETNEKAKMELKVHQLSSGVSLQQIREEIEFDKLSEKMRNCGKYGFKIGIIEDSDYDRIIELSNSFPRINSLGKISEEENEIIKQEIFFPTNKVLSTDSLKVEELKRKFIVTNKGFEEKPQEGIKFHLEFDYLLNTDLTYIFNSVREAIYETVLDRNNEIQNEKIRKKLLYEKSLIITLNIEQISTEKCIDIIVNLGIIEPLVKELILPYAIDIAGGISTYLIIAAYNKLRYKKAVPSGRNLKKKTISRVTYKKHRDGTIEIIEEIEKMEYD